MITITVRKSLLFIILLIVFSIPAVAQESLSQRISAQVEKYFKENPREKIYLHLDKDYYLPGEDVWFQGYLVESVNHFPSYISKVLYVDLIAPEDTLVGSITLKAEKGITSGDFRLPKSLLSGSYRIRAYTQWMRNFDQHYETTIEILGSGTAEKSKPLKSDKVDIKFLPEGGNLIGNLESKIAFKAIGQDGLGKDVRGEIVTSDGETVTTFSSQYRGMGAFSLKPLPGKKYEARVQTPAGIQKIALPRPVAKGFVMTVTPTPIVTQIRIQASSSMREPGYVLVGHQRGGVHMVISGQLKNNDHQLSIPNYKFSTGVLTFTLFDSDGVAQAERLIFIQKDDLLNVEVTTAKQTFKQRAQTTVDITTTDSKGKPVSANVSVAVTDAYAQNRDNLNASTILSHLLLTSDLKGYVEYPTAYFDNSQPGMREALDLLMQTQGWRKVNWKAVIENDFPPTPFLIEQGLGLSGTVSNSFGKPMKKGSVNLVIDNIFNTYTAELAENGRFEFGMLDFVDTSKLVLQARTGKNKQRDLDIAVDKVEPFEIAPSIVPKAPEAIPEKNRLIAYAAGQIQSREVMAGTFEYELEAVEITKRRNSKKVQTDPGALYREASHTLENKDFSFAPNPFEAIRGQMPGVTVNGSVGNYTIRVRNAGVGTMGADTQPLYLVNGTPVDAIAVETIPTNEIVKIDVLIGTRASVFGMRGLNGVVAIYTKTGADRETYEDDLRGMVRPDIRGFHITRTFYSPGYEVKKEEHDLPDLRTTIFWAPNVKTDANGKASLSFFNSDITGDIKVVIEGISPDGRPGYREYQYRIEE